MHKTKTKNIEFRPAIRPAADARLFEDALAELRADETFRRPIRLPAGERSAAALAVAVTLAVLASIVAALSIRYALRAEPEESEPPAPPSGFSVSVDGALAAVPDGRFVLATIPLDDASVAADPELRKVIDDGARLMHEAKANASSAAAACLGHEVHAAIDTRNVLGASGGLMFALAIVDSLSEGDITAGRVVSGTGAIAADGRVGKVLEIDAKVLGAERNGVDVFLVPAELTDEARQHATTVEIVGVATLADAVRALGAGDLCVA